MTFYNLNSTFNLKNGGENGFNDEMENFYLFI